MKSLTCLLCFFWVSVSAQGIRSSDLLAQEGISKELANYRKKQISEVSYDLSFAIPKIKEQVVTAELVVDLKISDVNHPLYFDFKEKKENLQSVVVNGNSIPVLHKREHLIVPAAFLKLGSNTVQIAFAAGNLSLNRNSDYCYTLLVPDRASTLFPCFDQPDIKATYTLTITAPKEWEVLAGTAVAEQTVQGDFTTYQFKTSDKLSTYLFSFVAGKFTKVTKNPGHFNMMMLYRETDATKIKASTDVIFNLHEQSLSFLEQYTQRPFPFQKFDFATIPAHPFGGMEHVGAIQYKEASLFLDSSATNTEKLGRGKLIAHETAHTWFGNLVTMKWFDDVWMKEVFANFMADKIMNPAFPEINHELQFLIAHYPAAYAEDRSAGTHPIKQTLANLKNAGSLYGSIIYDKAPIMMRQLETTMGEGSFQKGIQKYIEKYANSNADWNDLVEILDLETPLDIKQWSKVWVNQSGRPLLTDFVEYDINNRIKIFEIRQKAEDGSLNLWPQIFEIGLVYPDGVKVLKVALEGDIVKLDAAIGLAKPDFIIYNSNGYGYGVFPVDRDNLNQIAAVSSEVARAYSYINLYENVLIGKTAPLVAYECFLKGIEVEKDELIVRLLSNQLREMYWMFLTEKQQQANQNRLENFAYESLQKDLPANIKKILFGLFNSVAYSETAKERLFRIWNREDVFQNLKFNEDDYANIAMDLALFQHPKTVQIIEKTMLVTTNPDKQKRLAFLLPAVSNDEAVRDAFILSLKEEQNRVKAPWVISALGYLNHPLRQESTQKHLRLYLDLIEEIQTTGDLFFPKRWLTASVGRYSSPFAYQVVETFLKENPEFSPILKRKLLQATDGLDRAQKIKKETE
jgi:aminopeptidase N